MDKRDELPDEYKRLVSNVYDWYMHGDCESSHDAFTDLATKVLALARAAPSVPDAQRLDFLQANVSAIRDIGWLGGDLRAAIDAAMREAINT